MVRCWNWPIAGVPLRRTRVESFSSRAIMFLRCGFVSRLYFTEICRKTQRIVCPLDVGLISKDSASIQAARNVLLSEGIVALPSDTVYGVAALAQSVTAVRKLYAAKKRNPLKPVAICVGHIEDVYKWAKVTVSETLLQSLLPGPVTLVFERTADLNTDLNPDTNLVGIRIPNSDYIRTLAQVIEAPLALTSANASSERSTLSVNEFRALWPQMDLVIDGGSLCQNDEAERRQGSTVIDLSERGTFRVLRDGCCLKATREVLLSHGLRQR